MDKVELSEWNLPPSGFGLAIWIEEIVTCRQRLALVLSYSGFQMSVQANDVQQTFQYAETLNPETSANWKVCCTRN